MSLQDDLKNRRLELNLTMADLAKKVGVSEATISRWESGDIANMKRDKIVLLAKALQVPVGFVMGWEDDTPPQTAISNDDDIIKIERARHKMPDEEWERFMRIAVNGFEEYFKEDFVDEDTDE